MSDFLRLVLILIAAVNPAAFVLGGREAFGGDGAARLRAVAAAVLAFGVLGLAAVLADEILDFLEVAPETFRVAAGVVFLASSAATLLRPGEPGELPGGHLAIVYPLAWPLLTTPAAVAAAISLAADEGRGETVGAVALALAVCAAVAAGLPRAGSTAPGPWRGGARFLASVLVAFGAGLIMSGVRDV